jgi:aspartate racemase
MKLIGVIGGMSCESTALYYDALNRGARARLGGLSSAELLIRSVDFARIEAMQAAGRWDEAGRELASIAAMLERAGAGIILLATNTMHKVAAPIEAALASARFLHIADATGARVRAAGFRRPAIMATAYTMEQDFYTGRLRDRHGLAPVIPSPEDRAETHRIIYDELCLGEARPESRAAYEAIAGRLAGAGADCLILGCTEVGMLLSAANSPLPVFDTTLIHCEAALDAAIAMP